MAIAVTLPGLADIEEYNGLIEFIIEHLELDDETAARVPTFIRLAEARLQRLLTLPERETRSVVNVGAGEPRVPLPVNYKQLRTVYLDDAEGYPLSPVTLNVLYSGNAVTGRPRNYAIEAGNIRLSPTPDADIVLALIYMATIPPLDANNTTNWLLSEQPDVYVYSVLAQAESFLGNGEMAGAWSAAATEVIDEINAEGLRYRNASPMRLRSPVVV